MDVVQENTTEGHVLLRISGSVKIQDIAELYRQLLRPLQAASLGIDTRGVSEADFSLVQLLAAVCKEAQRTGTALNLEQYMGDTVCRVSIQSGYQHRICDTAR